jgi:hypothetical protein
MRRNGADGAEAFGVILVAAVAEVQTENVGPGFDELSNPFGA